MQPFKNTRDIQITSNTKSNTMIIILKTLNNIGIHNNCRHKQLKHMILRFSTRISYAITKIIIKEEINETNFNKLCAK